MLLPQVLVLVREAETGIPLRVCHNWDLGWGEESFMNETFAR